MYLLGYIGYSLCSYLFFFSLLLFVVNRDSQIEKRIEEMDNNVKKEVSARMGGVEMYIGKMSQLLDGECYLCTHASSLTTFRGKNK